MIHQHIILAILWLLFGFSHSLLASLVVKRHVADLLKNNKKYYRAFYTLFAFLSMAGILVYQFSIISPLLFISQAWLKIIAFIISFSGAAIMAICIKKYFFGLSGLKELVVEGHSNELIISGIHKYVRHPLYLGTFLFIWGLFLLKPSYSFLIANTIISIYTLAGIKLEENKLEQEFGEEYRHYKATVPMLLPFFKEN